MSPRASERHRVKVSVTVDPSLLKAIDDFVGEHAGTDRSKVFDEALYLWYAQQQAEAMAAQYQAPQSSEEQEEHAAWHRIQAAAARRIFGQGA